MSGVVGGDGAAAAAAAPVTENVATAPVAAVEGQAGNVAPGACTAAQLPDEKKEDDEATKKLKAMVKTVRDLKQFETENKSLIALFLDGAPMIQELTGQRLLTKSELGVAPAASNEPAAAGSKDKENDGAEPPWISFEFETGLDVRVCGRHIRIRILSIVLRLTILVLLWLAFWFLLPQWLSELQGYLFDPVLCFIMCSLIGKSIAYLIGVPSLFVIYLTGLMWTNIPTYRFLTAGITANIRFVMSRIGLAHSLLRVGLATSPTTLRPAVWNIVSMSILPLLVEVLVHGFMAQGLYPLYKGEALWPFLQALLVAPSAPGVTAAVTLMIQARGYTKKRGPGVLLLPACAIDITLGIWGISFVEGLITRDPSASLAWPIAKGPVQIIVGAIAGVLLGFLWYGCVLVFFSEAPAVISGAFVHRVSVWATFLLGLLACFCIFFANFIQNLGGGCIAVTMLAATSQYLSNREATKEEEVAHLENPDAVAKPYTSPPEHRYVRNQVVANYTMLWDDLVMPAIFAFSAASLNASVVFDRATLGYAMATIFVAWFARAIVCGLCALSYPKQTWVELAITAFALGGKGFAQAAFGSVGVNANTYNKNQGRNVTATETEYAQYVQTAGALSIIFVTPIVVVLLSVVGPCVMLTDAQHDELEAAEKKRKEEEEEREMQQLKAQPAQVVDEAKPNEGLLANEANAEQAQAVPEKKPGAE